MVTRRIPGVLGAALAEVVQRAGVPYGYTLTIWSAGALCIRRFGLPAPAETFLFLLGGSVGYGVLAGLARSRYRSGTTDLVVRTPFWGNAVVLPALGVAYGIALAVPNAYANFFVVPLAATALYLLGLSLVVTLTARARGQRAQSGPEEAHQR